jgi:hypothetical protein
MIDSLLVTAEEEAGKTLWALLHLKNGRIDVLVREHRQKQQRAGDAEKFGPSPVHHLGRQSAVEVFKRARWLASKVQRSDSSSATDPRPTAGIPFTSASTYRQEWRP